MAFLNSNQVVSIARSCIETAQDIYRIVSTNPPEEGAVVNIALPVEKLQTLQHNGQHLSRFSREQEVLFQAKEREQQMKFKSLNKEKERYELEKNYQQVNMTSLESQKINLLQERNNCHIILIRARSTLSSAERELMAATENLRRARIAINGVSGTTLMSGVSTGLVIGLLVGGPIGMAIGAGVGLVGSAILITQLQTIVARARSNVQEWRTIVRTAESRYHSAHTTLQSIQCQIDNYQISISNCEASVRCCTVKCKKIHEEIGSVRQTLAFISEAICLWNIFENLSQITTEQTIQLKKILQIVQRTQRYDFIGSNGARFKANSFLEAWNDLFADHNVPPVFSSTKASVN